jgi:hypothetical protein
MACFAHAAARGPSAAAPRHHGGRGGGGVLTAGGSGARLTLNLLSTAKGEGWLAATPPAARIKEHAATFRNFR